MTMKKKTKLLCEDNLRHNEYYGMQNTIDNLYQASLNGEVFTDLMSVILQRENILLAYRNIKKNTGSKTSGTDNRTIEDIGRCTPDEVVEKVRFIINGSEHGYRPKPVRRKEIPKPYDPSKTRPLGIPCIWDRLVQQCIKQVMEPVCEAKFSKNSYGFRPNHSVENAISHSQDSVPKVSSESSLRPYALAAAEQRKPALKHEKNHASSVKEETAERTEPKGKKASASQAKEETSAKKDCKLHEEPDSSKKQSKLQFDETDTDGHPGMIGTVKKGVGKTVGKAAVAVSTYTHGKIHEAEHENSAVEGAHKAELLAEHGIRESFLLKTYGTASIRKS